jgi:purine-binding chemotaxis protein CheW
MPTLTEAKETVKAVGAGKYLTFRLGQESYAIAVLKVREIIRLQPITPVPQMPAHIKGVINLRGKIIPVIDLRLKFALSVVKDTEQTCIVVVQVNLPSRAVIQMGVIVDAVEEVLNISSGEVEETPDFGAKLATDYILGMAKAKGSVKTLLDIDRVVSSDALESAMARA